jgi:HlyD family secretion protein
MRRWGTIGIILLGLVLAGTTACEPLGGEEEEISQGIVEVVRGDLSISISGSGNIEASSEAKLSFGSNGEIEKIYIEEGDKVSKGDLLAKLDTDALELALTEKKVVVTQAEVALIEKQVAITQAELALTEKQVAVTQAEVALTEKQVAVTQAQVTLETAEYNLYEARDKFVMRDIRTAQADVDEAQRYLEDALWSFNEASGPGVEFLQKVVIHAQSRLDTAKDRLEAMLAGTDPQEVAIKRLEAELAQQSLELAQQSQEQAQQSLALARQSEVQAEQSLELTRQSLELDQQSVALAQQSLAQAQKNLDEATIITPFDGVVASVDVEEGDTVSTSTTIIHLVDPGSMELSVEVDEIDVPEVKLGQEVIITLDALPDVEFIGEVTTILPVPIEEGGVVLFTIKINLDVPEGSDLRIGMSASADIIIDKRSNALLVPDRAIKQDSQGSPVVKVMINEQTQERAVVTGISDGFETEIVSGLVEGEMILIEP